MPSYQACCAHDHDCEAEECGPAWSLHKHVHLSHVSALNEAVQGSAVSVLRPWHQRLEPPVPNLDSNDDDPELLIHIPFDGTVKLKAVCIIGGSDGTAPSELRAFTNRDDLDFAAVGELSPVQRWELQDNSSGQLEYRTQLTKFNGVHSVDLHIPANFGAGHTRIHFIGLKGEFTQGRREAVVAVYETQPMPDTVSKLPTTGFTSDVA
ncbi:hypothetical protein WJX81_000448 [Elliptochloris bilobata]|uniref:PITH domain-containing protein n=1 Tax=Elliptochloris bilobata TaxID=381761 RepID=A0AAW1SH89_9CHLO